MPRRNLLAIFGVALVSLVCYGSADRNPFGRYFAEVVDHIEQRYVDNVDRGKLWDAAVKGMIGELHDPYSRYIDPVEAAKLDEELEQEFGGIGIQVSLDPKTERLTVISPIVGSPAYRAGVVAGDVIAKIDGVSTKGLTVEGASRLLRGAPGAPVRLTIERPGQPDPIELPVIERANVQIDSVLGDARHANDRWNYLLDDDKKIAYLRISTFGDRTVDELRAALDELKSQAVQGIVLDLRDNHGGLITAAIGVCEQFLPAGQIIVSVRGREKEATDRKFYSGNGDKCLDLPVAVLVNHHSASASEIVAACLQDHGRAVVIGERSFGKGTVQNIIALNGKRGKLTLTTADYVRPSGHNIHRHADDKETDEWGVKPDEGFELKMSQDELDKWHEWRRDRDIVRPRVAGDRNCDSKNDRGADGDSKQSTGDRWQEDPQLRRALEYIESKIGKRDPKSAASA
jgi:carboxyl-terminal processing protease